METPVLSVVAGELESLRSFLLPPSGVARHTESWVMYWYLWPPASDLLFEEWAPQFPESWRGILTAPPRSRLLARHDELYYSPEEFSGALNAPEELVGAMMQSYYTLSSSERMKTWESLLAQLRGLGLGPATTRLLWEWLPVGDQGERPRYPERLLGGFPHQQAATFAEEALRQGFERDGVHWFDFEAAYRAWDYPHKPTKPQLRAELRQKSWFVPSRLFKIEGRVVRRVGIKLEEMR